MQALSTRFGATVISALALLAAATLSVGCHDNDADFSAIPIPPAQAVQLDQIDPATADPGDTVLLVGQNFEAGTTATFGGAAATVSFVSDTQLQATVPAGTAGATVTVTVTNPDGSSDTGTFTYLPDATTPPVVVSIDPKTGPESGNTPVTLITRAAQASDTFEIGGITLTVQTLVDNGDGTQTVTGITNQLTTGIPGSYPVTITRAGLVSNTNVTFTYTASVVADRVSPNQGARTGGDPVTIHGRNFLDANGDSTVTAVLFNEVPVASFSVLDESTISTVTPAMFGAVTGAKGAVPLRIVGTPDFGEALLDNAFTAGNVLLAPVRVEALPNGVTPGSRAAFGDIVPSVEDDGGAYAVTLPDLDQVAVTNLLGSSVVGVTAPVDVIWSLVDNDAQPDAVVLQASGHVVVVYDEHTAGAPSTATFDSGVAGATGLSLGDFDRDGRLDLVVVGGAGASSTLAILRNDGAGGFLPTPVTIDLDASGGGQTPLRVIGAQPNGQGLLAHNPLVHGDKIDLLPKNLRFGFNDRDGLADIAVLNADGSITALRNTTPSNGASPTFDITNFTGLISATANPVDFAATDFNFDGVLDLVVLTDVREIAVIEGRPGAAITFLGRPAVQIPASLGAVDPRAITTGDVNFDGRDDIIVGNLNGEDVLVLLSDGGGAFGHPVAYKAQRQVDLNGTTNAVAVAVDRDQSVYAVVDDNLGAQALTRMRRDLTTILFGHAPTVLDGAGPLEVGTDPRAVILRDLDSDGDNDVVVANLGAGTIEVRLNETGFGTLGVRRTTPARFTLGGQTLGAPRVLEAGDVDADGDLDLVVAHSLGSATSEDQITVHLNNGVAVLSSQVAPIPIGGKNPVGIAVVDVNGDDRPDVLTCNTTSNNISVLFGDGAGNFTLQQLVGTGNAPAAFVVVDMGRPEHVDPASSRANLEPDGYPDIVVVNTADETVTVIYNCVDNGVYSLAPDPLDLRLSPPPANAGKFGLGETYPLGGFIVPNRHLFDAGVAGLPNDGLLTRGSKHANPSTPIEPIDVQVADMNRDGVLDILTLDRGTKTVTILYGNAGDRMFSPADPSDPDRRESHASGGTTGSAAFRTGSGVVGTMPPLASINNGPGIARKWFLPTDYRHQGTTTLIGDPAVVFPCGLSQPIALRVVDTDRNRRPDLVIAGFDDAKLVFFNALKSDRQEGQGAIPAFDPDTDAAAPPWHPPVVAFDAVNEIGGEAAFVSPIRDRNTFEILSSYPALPTFQSDSVPGKIIAIDVARMNRDVAPDVAVILDDDTLVIMKGE